MRSTLRLLAAVKPSAARYLEPGAPTGLTGLHTHSSPRSTLLYLYTRTLEKLADQVPETSLYRQSAEATTRHRLAIVEACEPPGYAAWAARAREVAQKNPMFFRVTAQAGAAGESVEKGEAVTVRSGGRTFVYREGPTAVDERLQEWDGERDEGPGREGLRGEEEHWDRAALFGREPLDGPGGQVVWENEPPLTVDQIEEIESKIGGGLLEEVVQTAENELKLVDAMSEGRVWEELEEKPAEGQWKYFERGQ
ncbi:ETC complex I subunit conserved region-domain-containing protein [Hypoxylon fragiforme]|uniref:ETC complex I subunit conserved region-domain-containing protein n=1 Tax=Hypoxylon fragiforme TaxID=63214 RepID=UPI0020C61DBF|nr:ETC complex I subunit conserved region-domain-containing protein [Hypoxylon fragiforme]KAI2614129.1 ETC complex I subunit conserved region-domain-containing protein [Hypoxylon fragiforme]